MAKVLVEIVVEMGGARVVHFASYYVDSLFESHPSQNLRPTESASALDHEDYNAERSLLREQNRLKRPSRRFRLRALLTWSLMTDIQRRVHFLGRSVTTELLVTPRNRWRSA